jgi:poly(3-hydroxybutyrate) depolymerase
MILRRGAALVALALGVALVAGGTAAPGAPPSPPGSPPGSPIDPTVAFVPDAEGYLRAWLVAGPFPYDKPRPPPKAKKKKKADVPESESDSEPAVDADDAPTSGWLGDALLGATGTGEAATRAVAGGAAAWRPFVSDDATVDLVEAASGPAGSTAGGAAAKKGPTTFAVAYAYVELRSATARDAFLRLGSDDGARVWVDGVELSPLRDPASHPHFPDRLSAPVHLRAGATPLLVKVDQRKGAWRFSLRLCDADDKRPPGVTVALPGTDAGAAARRALGDAILSATRVTFAAHAEPDGFTVSVTVAPPPFSARAVPALTAVATSDPPDGKSGGAPLPVRLAAPGVAPARLHLAPGGAARTLHAGALLEGLGGARREVGVDLPWQPKRHASLARAEALLAALRAAHPDLFTPRPAPRLGVWAEAGADAAPAPLAPLPPTGWADPHGALDATGAATLEWYASELRAALEAGDKDDSYVRRRAAALDRLVAAAAAGKDPLAGRTGPLFAAYRSRLDGTVQGFALYVPKKYTPKKRWPLYVGLHGLNGKPGRYLRYMAGVPLRADETNDGAERDFPDAPDLPDADAFLLAPYGRGDVAFRGPGEDDVLSALETVLDRWAIDRDQVHLTGASMGGIGVFELAVHRPDLWASAVPLCGAADVRMYASIGDRPVRDFEASVLAAIAAVEWAPNLRGLPVWCVHGTKDTTNPSVRSKVMIDRLASLGYAADVKFDEPPLGHNVWDFTYEGGRLWKEWKAKREAWPAHVTFTSGDLRYRSAYWVRLDAAAAGTGFATIDAVRDKAKGRITVVATGVRALSLLLGPAVARTDGEVEVVVNGATAFRGRAPGGGAAAVLSLRAAADGRFTAVAAVASPAEPVGPLGVPRAGPRLFTYATGTSEMRGVARALAEKLAAPGGIEASRLPVKPDWAVTGDDLARYDVVAVGNPATNWVLAAAARAKGGLPVTFERDALVLGGKRYVGRDVGCAFAVPSPFAPGRALVVYAGVGPAGLGLARHLPRYLPDYVVWDRGLATAIGGAVLGDRDVLAAGFF